MDYLEIWKLRRPNFEFYSIFRANEILNITTICSQFNMMAVLKKSRNKKKEKLIKNVRK